ncbi:phospholipase/carboxylesterase [Saccharopolyspora erythraea NRRL 2338]|uniref:Phospholipase/carboxylesterase family protein n=2 Tax=Saccharopolyspora erythraea TaxID=1836 RepID=A4FG09_SACEN|nr:dienelactone hydrolase family protein [Saccharopolyspora erythraea]EQD81639.1 phospholipase [Saccharopolyspora erythraea D]PFG96690.1 phospholipase/carboxylesterase [Saccharopolyspora erythraea NRRL 2338]QRK86948.1 dienelactone hydrolase family protein [Saccharopolyspora erythraea]CAM02984.1 phospholipase/carboxylesterase family protein [Saccharopolyspora erythraea NRRL 2338]
MNTLSLQHKFTDGEPDRPVLLLLHGTGGGPDDLLDLAAHLSPGSPVLAPAGPVSENGMARWFRRLREGVFDHDDVIARAGQLADFVQAARDHYGLHQRRLVAVGFSNGANIAAATALLRPDALREAAAFAAMLPVPEPPDHDLTGTRVLLSNGEQDPMAPLPSAEALADAFQRRNAEVATHRHPGGHQITADAIEMAKNWLTAPAEAT